jgi:tetratricopeptide (TPR) repeat protein
VEPHLLFASYLSRTGKDKMAEEEYLNALRYINNEEMINPSYFYEVYNYYIRKNNYWFAVKVMRKAAEFLPSDAGIRVSTGDLFEKLKLPDKAIEEYKYALAIDPKNGEAKKRLELLKKDKGF